MGTNYYVDIDGPCPTCGRNSESLHIGKSSFGWTFGLHAIPEKGLTDWPQWKELLSNDVRIVNEYGDVVTFEDMVSIVEDRRAPDNEGPQKPQEWYTGNHAEPGPNGLARRRISRHCVGHGSGTWDLIPGEFS